MRPDTNARAVMLRLLELESGLSDGSMAKDDTAELELSVLSAMAESYRVQWLYKQLEGKIAASSQAGIWKASKGIEAFDDADAPFVRAAIKACRRLRKILPEVEVNK